MPPSPDTLLHLLDLSSVLQLGLQWYAMTVVAGFALVSVLGAVRHRWL